MTPITMRNLSNLCKCMKNWKTEDIEKRFCGTKKELLDALNNFDYEELEIELFFSGFLCDNPIVELAADGQTDLRNLSPSKKVAIFIGRGLVLCYLTNHEPGFVVKPYWHNKNIQ